MVRLLIPVLLLTLVAVGPAAAEDEGRAQPRSTQMEWISASIRAVLENGVAQRMARVHGVERSDGTVALPIKHVVRCDTASICTRVGRWAQNEGFAPSRVLTEYLHGGVARYEVHLTRDVPLDPEPIQADALRIHEALSRMTGSRYETWMLDVDPDRSRDAR